DDEQFVVKFCNHILTGINGFDVLQATDGAEAIDVADHYDGTIDLLLSDIVMNAGLNGVELAEILTKSRPGMKVLLMSGCFSAESFFHEEWHFISKPFLPAALVCKVEEALGQPLHQKARTARFAR